MKNRTKSVIAFAFAFLAVAQLSYSTPNMIKGDAENQSTYTIITDDGYYAKTTYYLTEQAYQDYLESAQPSMNYSAKSANATSRSVNTSDEDIEFVLGAVQTVCVYEQVGTDGNITESRLLTSPEIDGILDESISGGFENDTIGVDAESFYYLNISMSVVYNNSSKQYSITGTASWKEEVVSALDSYKAAEEWDFDYIGFTWGGDKALIAKSQEISGNYYNDQKVSFARKTSDAYVGYVWQFKEKSGFLGKEMELATAKVDLAKVGTSENKETNVKMTYIHTYGAVDGSVSFNITENKKIAPSLTLSKTQKQWQIEIDITGIKY